MIIWAAFKGMVVVAKKPCVRAAKYILHISFERKENTAAAAVQWW